MFSPTLLSGRVIIKHSERTSYVKNIMLIPDNTEVWVYSHPSWCLGVGDRQNTHLHTNDRKKKSKGRLRHWHLGSNNGFKVDVSRKPATHWLKPDSAETTRVWERAFKWTLCGDRNWDTVRFRGYSVFKDASADGWNTLRGFLYPGSSPQARPSQYSHVNVPKP